MKPIILFMLFTLGIVQQASAVNASVTISTFKGESQNYAEVYFFFAGESVHYKTVGNKIVAAVETVILFKQGEKIVNFDKFTLNSPSIKKDTTVQISDFANLKRYALPSGNYTVEITLKDLFSDSLKQMTYQEEVELNYGVEKVQVSDLQPVSKYSKAETNEGAYVKNGFFIETHPFAIHGQQEKTVKFYTEVYNGNSLDSDFYIRYFIKKKGSDDDAKPLQMRAKKLDRQPTHAMILQLAIMDLPTGEYELVLEARDQTHQVLSAKRYAFKRINPYLNHTLDDYKKIDYTGSFVAKLSEEQVDYSLRAIKPKLEKVEVHNQVLKFGEEDEQRKYLYNYWVCQDHNTPEEAFNEYMKLAQKVDKAYRSAMGLGFETDRGYVYLKYGQPNDVLREVSDPTAPPYEIWKYFELKGQQDVRFVFANPTLAVNDFKVIHSTLLGELSNPNWLRDLYEKSPIKSGNYLDNPKPDDQMGRNAGDRIDQ